MLPLILKMDSYAEITKRRLAICRKYGAPIDVYLRRMLKDTEYMCRTLLRGKVDLIRISIPKAECFVRMHRNVNLIFYIRTDWSITPRRRYLEDLFHNMQRVAHFKDGRFDSDTLTSLRERKVISEEIFLEDFSNI